MVMIGSYYFEGFGGLMEDQEEAFKWFRRVVETNSDDTYTKAFAMATIGLYYEYGRWSLPVDKMEAKRWYRKAAETDADVVKMLRENGKL